MAATVADLEPIPADAPTFEAEARASHDALLRLAYLLSGDQRVAEEAVAEALARVYGQWQRGKVADFGPYARRAVVNQLRGGFRRRILERREEARRRGDDRGGRALDDQVADREALKAALLRLPPRQRAAVVLRYYEDLSEAQAAEVLGTSVGTVKSQVSRGLDRLRTMLDEERGS